MSIKNLLRELLATEFEVVAFYKLAVVMAFSLTIYITLCIAANHFIMISMTASTDCRWNIMLFILVAKTAALRNTFATSITR